MHEDDERARPSGDPPGGDEQSSGTWTTTEGRAAEITELSLRAMSAKVNLITYIDQLEDEVRRLRRQLGDAAP
jgi:hypothetical protein